MRTEIKRLLGVEIIAFFVVVASVISIKLYGAESDVAEVPAFLKTAMDFLTTLPYVGPLVLSLLKWTGVVAAVMTGISTMVMGVANALKVIGVAMGFQGFAEKVDGAYKAIWPWIAFLSMYNVPKNKLI